MGVIKTKDLLPIWRKERDAAIFSFDVDTFRAFYEKWKRRGFYDIDLPEKGIKGDWVLEITMRKMVLGLADPPEDIKKQAEEWLIQRGYDLEPFAD